MGRPATGCAQWHPKRQIWIAWLTINGKRVPQDMPGIPEHETERAKAFAAVLSKRARDRGAVASDTTETCEEYFDRWAKEREARKLSVARNDRSRWKKWIAPHLGTKAIVEVTKRDLEMVVGALDRDVRASRLSWKTARHAWGMVRKMLDDACRAKDLSLRVRDDNPARDVRGPDRGDNRGSPYLFPSELLQLVSCMKVPIARRRLYVLASYTGLRAGELRALDWSDVHEAEGYIHVHRSANDRTGKIGPTKTKATRKVPIQPHLVPLLEMMRDEVDGKGLVVAWRERLHEWSLDLRSDLRAADVSRVDLFANDRTRRWIHFHDLRHGFGTWLAVAGAEAFKIQRAMGHTDLTMTNTYVNEAFTFDAAHFGEPFGVLPIDALRVSSLKRYFGSQVRDSLCEGGDLKKQADSASQRTEPAETQGIDDRKPTLPTEFSGAKLSVETLRAKLDRAIVAEQWEAVKVIAARIRELEREQAGNVVELKRTR